MLTTANATFKLNRDGTLDIKHKPGFRGKRICSMELFYIVHKAISEARRLHTKKPDKYRERKASIGR